MGAPDGCWLGCCASHKLLPSELVRLHAPLTVANDSANVDCLCSGARMARSCCEEVAERNAHNEVIQAPEGAAARAVRPPEVAAVRPCRRHLLQAGWMELGRWRR